MDLILLFAWFFTGFVFACIAHRMYQVWREEEFKSLFDSGYIKRGFWPCMWELAPAVFLMSMMGPFALIMVFVMKFIICKR